MIKKIIASVLSMAVCVILGFVTSSKVEATVTYADKSFDRYGRVLFWVQTEGSNYLRQVSCPAKVGDTIILNGLSISSIVFFTLALCAAIYFVYLIIEDIDN